MKEEKNTASECQHDFDSNEESDYCAKGCGEKWSLFTIKSLKQQVADYEAALEGTRNYLHWREDDLIGDDLKGDGRLTARFKQVIGSIYSVLNKYGVKG